MVTLLAALGALCVIACGRYGPPVRAASDPESISPNARFEPEAGSAPVSPEDAAADDADTQDEEATDEP